MTDTMTAAATLHDVVTLPPTATRDGSDGAANVPERGREVVFDLTA